MPFHVRITSKSRRSYDEVKLDLSEPQLQDRILRPYREGRSIVIGGKTIPPDDIERIRITHTRESSEKIFPVVRAEHRASSVATMISDEWYVADKGEDVTDDYIIGPPGQGLVQTNSGGTVSLRGPRVVFVVHGRNLKLRDSIFSFLRTIGLHPLEWSEAVVATGKPLPYVGEILDKAFEIAGAILVLLSPDDEAHLRLELRSDSDPPHETELTGQARPNVLFEAGLAFGRCPDRTVLVEVGVLRPFSDVGGRHVIRLDNSTQHRQELAQRLEIAGCPVNLTGSDWHQAGDFALVRLVERGTT